MGDHRDESVPARPRVVLAQPPPVRRPELRDRFLNVLGLRINHEHDKSFVRVR